MPWGTTVTRPAGTRAASHGRASAEGAWAWSPKSLSGRQGRSDRCSVYSSGAAGAAGAAGRPGPAGGRGRGARRRGRRGASGRPATGRAGRRSTARRPTPAARRRTGRATPPARPAATVTVWPAAAIAPPRSSTYRDSPPAPDPGSQVQDAEGRAVRHGALSPLAAPPAGDRSAGGVVRRQGLPRGRPGSVSPAIAIQLYRPATIARPTPRKRPSASTGPHRRRRSRARPAAPPARPRRRPPPGSGTRC